MFRRKKHQHPEAQVAANQRKQVDLKTAAVDATMRSHCKAISIPPVMQGPLTAAMVGTYSFDARGHVQLAGEKENAGGNAELR